MPTINIDNIQPQNMLFHNEWIRVFPTYLPLESINYWRDNSRTLFTFERLCSLKGKREIEDISIEEITTFVAEQDIHKLQALADSIERRGVLVPLIITDEGKLLDGNRRYFACQWLKMKFSERSLQLPDEISTIPVQVIRKADLTDELELKILAEANFIPDLKTAWPLEAQARIVEKYYLKISRDKKSNTETILDELTKTFGISRQRATDFLGALKLAEEFIEEKNDHDNHLKRRAIVEDKFLYFLEFQNKATKGRDAYKIYDELQEVKEMFFTQLNKGRDTPIKNVRHVKSLVQAKRNDFAWRILKESNGAKLPVISSMIDNNNKMRKAEDRIRFFLAWLNDVEELNPLEKLYLKEVINVAEKKCS
jgi:hypothetical protein